MCICVSMYGNPIAYKVIPYFLCYLTIAKLFNYFLFIYFIIYVSVYLGVVFTFWADFCF